MNQNNVLKVINERRSIRSFENKELTQEQLEALSKAALESPTARNLQQLRFAFILDNDSIEAVSQATISAFEDQNDHETVERIKSRHSSLFYGAPLVIVISGRQDNNYSGVDSGIAVQTLALAAQSMGLGSCIIGLAAAGFAGKNKDSLYELVRMPKDHRFMISIAVGHPAISKEPHELKPENITYIR